MNRQKMGILTEGVLPRDAIFTEDTFDAEYYLLLKAATVVIPSQSRLL